MCSKNKGKKTSVWCERALIVMHLAMLYIVLPTLYHHQGNRRTTARLLFGVRARSDGNASPALRQSTTSSYNHGLRQPGGLKCSAVSKFSSTSYKLAISIFVKLEELKTSSLSVVWAFNEVISELLVLFSQILFACGNMCSSMASGQSNDERLSLRCNISIIGIATSFMHAKGGCQSHIEAVAFTTRCAMNCNNTALRKSAHDLYVTSLHCK